MDEKIYEYKEISVDDILEISSFLNATFGTTKFSVDYLNKLYFDKDSAIGYNVFHGELLIAHYCVVRRVYEYLDQEYLIGWSVNTAVHKEFRGRGFFLDLAKRSYDLAKNQGIVAIVGVANRNSTRLFLEKLGFENKGMVRWHIDLFAKYERRNVFPRNLSHLNHKIFRLGGSFHLRTYPFIKIYSNRNRSFLCIYLTNRQRVSGIGFSLPQNWFKSNWQVISLNLQPSDKKVDNFLKYFAIDIAESDTF